jgi:GNAT superfamily N-acetyltransferase
LADWLVAVDPDLVPEEMPQSAAAWPGSALRHAGGAAFAGADASRQGQGLGGHVVNHLVQLARQPRLSPDPACSPLAKFFVRLGFEQVDRWSISPKIWQACIDCSKFHRCDEVADDESGRQPTESAAPV